MCSSDLADAAARTGAAFASLAGPVRAAISQPASVWMASQASSAKHARRIPTRRAALHRVTQSSTAVEMAGGCLPICARVCFVKAVCLCGRQSIILPVCLSCPVFWVGTHYLFQFLAVFDGGVVMLPAPSSVDINVGLSSSRLLVESPGCLHTNMNNCISSYIALVY